MSAKKTKVYFVLYHFEITINPEQTWRKYMACVHVYIANIQHTTDVSVNDACKGKVLLKHPSCL